MNETTALNPATNRSQGVTARLLIAMGDIKLAHSVFAMPFAVLGAFLVAPSRGESQGPGIDWPALGGMLALVVVCMVFARNWAMLANRVADAKLDAAPAHWQTGLRARHR